MTTIDSTIDPPDLDAAAGLAADAAGSVPGVHALGSLLGRASDAVRERVGLASTAPGVKIDTDRADRVTATISLVVDYPHKLHEVSDAVRGAVRDALQPLGRGRVDVDVVVTGVFGPFDRDPVDEAEEKVDAATEAIGEKAGEAKAAVRERADRAGAVIREKAADASQKIDETTDAVAARTAGIAAAFAESADETSRERRADVEAEPVEQARETIVEPAPASDDEVRDVVAEALQDAAVDIAIAADEVRGEDKTPATDDVQAVVEDERPRS
ncbi:Asp23/Gls24 family envelope stress response protein [uncultured Microbacterium sp.]|uniref:Asp23/Gls24 family envelope stress response protein n=1 Tax=uncultured Microbacterium sp. TaxID=191216 RepID=UPI0025ED339C|nr:Asp23/Gls24 family envelope stress response protein [uncultured Microbacterium sp.]